MSLILYNKNILSFLYIFFIFYYSNNNNNNNNTNLVVNKGINIQNTIIYIATPKESASIKQEFNFPPLTYFEFWI